MWKTKPPFFRNRIFTILEKKIHVFSLFLFCIVLLTGCGIKELKTDVGAKPAQETDSSQYLDLEALTRVKEGNADTTTYTLYTLEKGTFVEPVLAISLYRTSVTYTPVIAKVKSGIMKLVDYPVATFDYVEEGDVIANVLIEGDSIAITEKEMQRDRLQERLADAGVTYESDRQKRIIAYMYPVDAYAVEINALELEQFDRTWQYTKANYERQIQAIEEEIQVESESLQIVSIKAPTAGICIFDEKLNEGDTIENNVLICNIIPKETIYMTGENSNNSFQYGMTLDYKGASYDLPGGATGTIIGGTGNLLYGNLDSSDILVELAVDGNEVPRLMSVQGTGDLEEMKNCILVPENAVTIEETKYFVTLYKEDGSLLKTEFIPGGTNGTVYWVISGLEEGMIVLIDG